jgi:hypothetical protein
MRKAPQWVIALCLTAVMAELRIVRQWLFFFSRGFDV